ncbi:MAG: M23 family metallopeptidase [Leptolyngbyaceae cyanobacterium SM2_5_2]|nr:M23 family metallopeptidase [Leptolyngbyaceae cyanobacterium SM2_5_2]
MTLRQLKPYTVLITATGKAPITLVLRPSTLLIGLGLLVGIPTLWITALTYHNWQLAQRNQTLTQTATEVLTQLDAIGAEIKVLKTRAGLPDGHIDSPPLDPEATPRGGLAEAAPPEAMFEAAKRQLPGLETELSTDVKPALEETLELEAERASAFPSGKPLAGQIEVSSEFGLRPNPFGRGGYEVHGGIDFAGPVGQPILATAEGIVVKASYDRGYGNHVQIDHGYSYETLYAHLSRLQVKVGDRVQRGDVIGLLGSTGRSSGPHLHYGVYRNGRAINPRYFLKLENSPSASTR